MESKGNAVAIVSPEQYGLEESATSKAGCAFMPMAVKREELCEEFLAVSSAGIADDNIGAAKGLAKKLVTVRTGIEKIRKVEKNMSLRYGQFVDAVAKAETAPVTQMEERVKEITQHHANLEKERKAKVHAERMELAMAKDPDSAQFEEDYSRFPEGQWESMYENLCWLKERRDEKEAKAKTEAEAAEKAEQERIKAEQEEQERIRKENERLKKEAEERVAAEAKERAEREAAEAKREKAEAAERAKVEAEREKERKAAEAKLAKERAERERIEAEAKAKEDAEAKAKADAEAREKDTANRKRVNNAILAEIAGKCASDEAARALIKAIAKGEVPNVSIKY